MEMALIGHNLQILKEQFLLEVFTLIGTMMQIRGYQALIFFTE